MRIRRALLAVVLAPAMLSPTTATADGGQRLYLLADNHDYLYWSPDASDPETPARSITRRCGQYPYNGLPDDASCRVYGDGDSWFSNLDFMQNAALRAPIEWGPDEPLRFHLELTSVRDALGEVPYSVAIGVGRNDGYFDGSTATEVAPGIWEGELATPGAMHPSLHHTLYVSVITAAVPVTIELATGGSSWIEVPDEDATVGVPALLAADSGAIEPSSYVTPERSFAFNDRDWEAHSFSHDGGARFDFDIARDAMVIAWTEVFDSAAINRAVNSQEIDPNTLVSNVDVSLWRDGTQIAHGGRGGQGWGADITSATAVTPGTMELRIASPAGGVSEAHVLVIYGSRTLSRMLFRFSNSALLIGGAPRALVGGSVQQFPSSAEMRSLEMTLSWDSVSPAAASWVPTFGLPNGGSSFGSGVGNGPRVRVTYPIAGVWYVSAALPNNRNAASYRDTVFELDVRVTYSPRT